MFGRAYANAGESHPQLYKKFAYHIVAMKDLSEFKSQDLSNIAWAFATAGESHPKLFSKVSDHIDAMKDLSAFLPQHISNIAWAWAMNGICSTASKFGTGIVFISKFLILLY